MLSLGTIGTLSQTGKVVVFDCRIGPAGVFSHFAQFDTVLIACLASYMRQHPVRDTE